MTAIVTAQLAILASELQAGDRVDGKPSIVDRVEIVTLENPDGDLVNVWIQGQALDSLPWWIFKGDQKLTVLRKVGVTPPVRGTLEYELWSAAIDVALDARPGDTESSAKVPWFRIDALRAALVALGIDWQSKYSK
jgi:hypothetical protein